MKPTDPSSTSLDEKVDFLRRPGSYPEETTSVDVVETHMSWVFLTDRYVYKLKKPVRFKLLNLATLEDRRRNCHEEVRLNRRLARDVYLGVVPLGRDETGSLIVGSEATVEDWLVKMRRLPSRLMLDRAIERGEVTPDDVRRLSATLAEFYRRAPAVEMRASKYRHRFVEDVRSTVQELEALSAIPGDRVGAVSTALLDYVERRAEVFDGRVREGRIVEGHGDLRPEHVCLLPSPVVIDCVEFSRDLRTLDPAEELSFLSVECHRLGGPTFLQPLLLGAYVRETGDEPAHELVHFYEAFRAFLRAQMAIWHVRDPEVSDIAKWKERAEGYVALAARLIAESPELSAHPSRSSTIDPPR